LMSKAAATRTSIRFTLKLLGDGKAIIQCVPAQLTLTG
jgi:hypothetical protein